MESTGFICVLLCVSVHAASSVKQSCDEETICMLRCGKTTEDSVTWSRDVDGKREKILTVYRDTVTKHIADPDGRYSSGKSHILIIFRVSHSDAGRYYCSKNTVELSVMAKTETSTQSTQNATKRGSSAHVPVYEYLCMAP